MRRALALGPLVVLTGACAMRPWTPSVSVAFWAQPTPEGQPIFAAPDAAEVISRWQLPPTNPWAPFQKFTLHAALRDMSVGTSLPNVAELESVQNARECARKIGAAGVPPGTLVVVDLRGAASVAFGAELSRVSSLPVSLVPTFNNWPADDEVVPAEETLAALLAESPRLPDPAAQSTTPVLLLDAWRLAFRFDEPDEGTVDNRYALTPSDLPDATLLRAQGIRRVLYVVEDLDDAEVEEDDLNGTFLGYQQAGLEMTMVDLHWIEGRSMAVRWDEELHGSAFRVATRRTLLDDPVFFARAHGGWGGVHAVPHGWGGPGRSVRGFGG